MRKWGFSLHTEVSGRGLKLRRETEDELIHGQNPDENEVVTSCQGMRASISFLQDSFRATHISPLNFPCAEKRKPI